MEDKKDLFKSILLSDLDDNISIYKNLGYHISSLKKDQIIKDDVLIEILEKLEDIYGLIKLEQFKIDEDINISTDKFKLYNNAQIDLKYKLKSIILDIGTNHIYEILKLCMESYDFENYKTIIENDIEFIDKYFQINKIIINTNHEISSLDIKFIENKDPIITPSFNYILNNCILSLRLGPYSFLFHGYFKTDPLNSLFKEELFNEKFTKLNKCVNLLSIPYKFKLGYLNQISYTDFTIKSIDDIIQEINSDYDELKKLSKILISNLLNDFIRLDKIKQRKILILLLLSKDEDHIIANILYENVRSLDIRDTLHWSIRKLLNESSNLKILAKKKLFNIEITELTYEERLLVLKTSEKNKSKALAKIKDLNSSKESSAKAETYLNSFFKIPFGIYKEEEIFTYENEIKNNKNNIINLIKQELNIIPEISKNDLLLLINNKNISKLDLLSIEIIIENSISFFSTTNSTSNYNKLLNIKNKINKLIEQIDSTRITKQSYLNSVRSILDSAVYGQDDVKKQLEILFGQWMNGKMEGAVIGLQGPPGTGKTQIAREGIAKCLKDSDGNTRPFCFIPLGGARDGSVLEGHSYTYLGSQWGKLVDLLIDSKCMNPIIFFDEVDKVSTTDHGNDIINILIHLTDPTQNKEIYDKYFAGVELDFSKCIFIFSYNDSSSINKILRDRITEIKIKPLKLNEKIIIVENYLLPEIYENIGIDSTLINFPKESIKYLIETYTFESGIRKTIEKLKEIFREINYKIIKSGQIEKINIIPTYIDNLLSRHYKIEHTKIHNTSQIGLINGLYATNVGIGGITIIQVIKILSDTKLSLELTGQQGNVMKESMACAKTLAWNLLSNQKKKEIKDEWEKIGSFGFHIHCPECATPKDGPSAGIAITTAIYSVLIEKPISNTIAMTGEVDIIGNVKAIGGLDAKIAGAIKAGCTKVLIPKENEQDYNKLSSDLKKSIEIVLVSSINEVILHAIILS
jgi:endopeptidase La